MNSPNFTADFNGKVVAVTGGARGIGKCLVQTFASLGAIVHFCDIDSEAGKAVVAETPGVRFIKVDLAVERDIQNFASQVLESGPVHVLINNVGVTAAGHSFKDRPLEEWDRVIRIGLTSHFLCSQLFAPALIETGGAIVNIASTRALMSESDTDAYSASKGGVVSLTHSLAVTLGREGVRVNCISPGWIDVTGWQFPPQPEPLSEAAHRQHPAGRVGRPEDIAEACLFLASNRSAGFITGQNLVVDGGMTKRMVYVE